MFSVFFIFCGLPLLALSQSATINVYNNCPGSLLVRQNGNSDGNMVGSGSSTQFNANWGDSTLRVDALTGCDDSGNNCAAPGPYQSLGEFHWDSNGGTWYDVSMVDGFTIAVSVNPTNPGVGPDECSTAACSYNLPDCQGNQINDNNGNLVACQNPDRDNPTAYSASMNSECPDAYAWSKDDQRRPSPMRFYCNPGNDGLNVQFC